MSRILYDDHARVCAWMKATIGWRGSRPATQAKTLGLENDAGELVIGVMYESYTGCNVNMHVVIDKHRQPAIPRQLLLDAFGYPFITLNCVRVTGIVPADNAAALHFDRRLGFEDEAVIRQAHQYPDGRIVDYVVLVMWRERCRWLTLWRDHGRLAA